VALNRNNRQKARSAFFGNNSGLETSKYSTIYKKTTFSLFDLFK